MKLRVVIIVLLGLTIVSVVTVRGCRTPESKGGALYEKHCASCHGKSGEGFYMYPPVADADYMREHRDEIACIIYYGMEGEITVNGVQYDGRMIGNPDLTATQIANLSNYIYGEFNNGEASFKTDDILDQLENCDREIVK